MPLGLKRLQPTGHSHFLTFTCYRRMRHLTSEKACTCLLAALEDSLSGSMAKWVPQVFRIGAAQDTFREHFAHGCATRLAINYSAWGERKSAKW